MIDYEKLKLAFEIAERINCFLSAEIKIGYDGDRYCHFIATLIEENNNSYFFESIDDLITKLKELTCPKPKYEVGDKVYVVGITGGLHRTAIKEINHGTYVLAGRPNIQFVEDSLYPTKEALIDAQIEYWHSLKEPVNPEDMQPKFEGEKISFRCFDDEMEVNQCQHESDGISYRASDYGVIAHSRCKKCGEFYR
ncbi:TPA: hypothetical protein NQN30_000376 [Legionella pneumophila]|nr:hypothetical protein [Legionella pneumophila]